MRDHVTGDVITVYVLGVRKPPKLKPRFSALDPNVLKRPHDVTVECVDRIELK